MTARERAARAGLVRESSGDFMLYGVEFNRPNTACSVSRASASANLGFSSLSTPTQTSTYWRWALRTCFSAALGRGDERRGCGGYRHAGAGKYPGAVPDQQLAHQRCVVGKKAVDGRATDAGC